MNSRVKLWWWGIRAGLLRLKMYMVFLLQVIVITYKNCTLWFFLRANNSEANKVHCSGLQKPRVQQETARGSACLPARQCVPTPRALSPPTPGRPPSGQAAAG